MCPFYSIGEQKIRPGTYIRYTNEGGASEGGASAGIGAAAFRATWGPLGTAVTIESTADIDKYFGAADGAENNSDIITEMLKSARRVVAIRLGTGGSFASYIIKDTTGSPVNVITCTAKYAGSRALSVTIKDSLADSGSREFIVYEGTKELQKITFAKGSGEIDALIAAHAASGSNWVTLSKTAAGNGTLQTLTQQSLAGGANPTVANEDYSNAFTAIESLDWDVLAVDTNEATVQALVHAYIQRVFGNGKLARAVVGATPGVDVTVRMTAGASYNDFCMHHVLNGFKDAAGTIYDGWKAAARVAGLIAAGPSNKSFTHDVISGAVDLSENLTGPQIEAAIQKGNIVFTVNANGQIQIEYGINTLVTPTADQDSGWKKIRRVSTRIELMKRVTSIADPLIGRVDNNTDGRATIIAAAQGVINRMIQEGKLIDGLIYEDPSNPPVGDSAWFKLDVNDLDSAEKIYLSFGFRFAPEA